MLKAATAARSAVYRSAVASVLALSLGLAGPAWAQDEQPAPGTGGDIIGYGDIHKPVIGRGGMVVGQSKLASRVGTDILAKGGNAVDAAVAVGIVETLTLPRAGNLGGGGYMLIYMADTKKTTAIEYYGNAPLAVTPDFLLNDKGEVDRAKTMSFKGATVPGTVAGLYEAHKRFGKMKWADVIQPSIDLATNGIVMTDDEADALNQRKATMSKDPNGALKVYFKPDGSSYKAGEIFKNPDLAWTLKHIAERGADGFYKGPVAEKIVAGSRAGGGIFSMEDLANYKANVSEPIWGTYRGVKIAYMPATSAGATLAEVMNMIEHFPMDKFGWGNVNTMHVFAEALKIAWFDWRYNGGGPQWRSPSKGIASKEFAAQRVKLISMDKSLGPKDLPELDPFPFSGPDTTSYSTADKDGNVVSNTYTLSASFGAHVVAPGTGFLLNNSLGNFDFKPAPTSLGNMIAPGKRARSGIAPIIIFKDDKPWVATGSPGSATIVSTLAQLISNLVDHKLNIAEASGRPRMSQFLSDEPLQIESGVAGDLVAGLEAKGHKVQRTLTTGSVQSIMLQPNGVFLGSADSRRPDSAAVAVIQY